MRSRPSRGNDDMARVSQGGYTILASFGVVRGEELVFDGTGAKTMSRTAVNGYASNLNGRCTASSNGSEYARIESTWFFVQEEFAIRKEAWRRAWA